MEQTNLFIVIFSNRGHMQTHSVRIADEKLFQPHVYILLFAKREKKAFVLVRRHLRNATTSVSHQGLGRVFVFKPCQEAFNSSKLPTFSLL